MEEAGKQFKIGLKLLLVYLILTGIIYPIMVTILAQLFFPWQANGSFLKEDNKIIGSVRIGQSFTDPRYFSGRPSATRPFSNNSLASGGSNLALSNPTYLAIIKQRVSQLQAMNPGNLNLIPIDLVTASGSGLDPEISPEAAIYQISRVAKSRNLTEQDVFKLVNRLSQHRTFWILGKPRINVLQLNVALDQITRNLHGNSSP